jgi:hypothetical protein
MRQTRIKVFSLAAGLIGAVLWFGKVYYAFVQLVPRVSDEKTVTVKNPAQEPLLGINFSVFFLYVLAFF